MFEWFVLIGLAIAVCIAFTRLLKAEHKIAYLERYSEALSEHLTELKGEKDITPVSSSKVELAPSSVPTAADSDANTEPDLDSLPDKKSLRVISKTHNDASSFSVMESSTGASTEMPKAAFSEKMTQKVAAFSSLSFEDIVGGKLPIWIGGIALAFAGFFMVRYSIEAGLFGPGARTITATLFGLILIAVAELGGRLPKIGAALSQDKRVSQSLAGAGIAILYATLYMASELYGLLSITTAFILVVVVTVIALTLSLRHGPPTAIMGVIGGFLAPWVAGMGADNMPVLLLYLGVFIAGLFGLAIWQGWMWLLLLATGGGALWTLSMLVSAETGLSSLGLFITVLGAAAVFGVMRMSSTNTAHEGNTPFKTASIYAPMGLALLQMAVLLPRMEFSPTGWLFMVALSGLSLFLSWRDNKLLPLAGMAAIGFIAPIWIGWQAEVQNPYLAYATVGYAVLFAGTAHAWLWRKGLQDGWATIATLTPFAAYLIPLLMNVELSDAQWALLAVLPAASAALVAWHYRVYNGNRPPVLSASVTAVLVMIAAMQVIPEKWFSTAFALIAGALMAWGTSISKPKVRRLGYAPMLLASFCMCIGAINAIGQMTKSLIGEYPDHRYLTDVSDVAIFTFLPALILLSLALIRRFGMGFNGRLVAIGTSSAGVGLFAWLLAKQIFQISSNAQFVEYGFAERMMITQILALGGMGLAWYNRAKANQLLKYVAFFMVGAAIFRFAIFDLILFNPLYRAQAVGPAPIANLAVIHCLLLAITCWLMSQLYKNATNRPSSQDWSMPFAIASMAIQIGAALVAVRQWAHGSIFADMAVTTGENYLYSVALMLLALAWLALGIVNGTRFLRLCGLGLLTLVTLKVFLIDAAALEGILRILSFLGLGIALIAIGWAYGRLMGIGRTSEAAEVTQS